MKDCRYNKDKMCRWNHLCKFIPHCLGMLDKFNIVPTGEVHVQEYNTN